MKVIGPDCFATMILDNLRKAGVQNTRKGERLKFDPLEPLRRRVDARGGRVHRRRRQGAARGRLASARSTAPSARSR